MISELTAAVNGIKAARDAAKLILDENKQFDQAEFRLQFVEVVGKLSDATDKMVDVKQRVGELEEEIASLKETLKHRAEMTFDRHRGFYWRKVDANNLDGPYCPRCWNDRERIIIMVFFPGEGNVCQCVSCGYLNRERPRVNAVPTAGPSFG